MPIISKAFKTTIIASLFSIAAFSQAQIVKQETYGDVVAKTLNAAEIYSAPKRTDVVIYGTKIQDFQEILNIFAVALDFKLDKLMDLQDLAKELSKYKGTDKKFEVTLASAAYLDINPQVGKENIKALLKVLNDAEEMNYYIHVMYLQ